MRKLILLMCLAAPAAMAANVEVNWTHPTAFTDGTPLSVGQIASTRVEYGSCAGTAFGVKAGEVVVNAPATQASIPLAPGTHCFRAYTKTTAAAGGLESVATNVAQKVVPYSPPNPPVLTVINVVAYEIQMHPVQGPRLAREVGRVPLGTACGEEPIVYLADGTYYEVPLDQVELYRMPKSAVVVAKCG